MRTRGRVGAGLGAHVECSSGRRELAAFVRSPDLNYRICVEPARILLLVVVVLSISACTTGYTGQAEALYRRTGQESMLWKGYVCPCD
jgi:hypothetical protein